MKFKRRVTWTFQPAPDVVEIMDCLALDARLRSRIINASLRKSAKPTALAILKPARKPKPLPVT